MGNGTKSDRPLDVSNHKINAANFAASLKAQQEPHDWLRIDEQGRCEYIPADKHGIVERLDIPYRDLRMVDPLIPIPYPSAIFIRDRALVVNLENIRMIICHDQAFFLGVPGPHGSQDWEAPTETNWLVEEVVEQLRDPDASQHSVPPVQPSGWAYNSKQDVALPYEMRVLESALWGCHHQLQREVDMLDGPAGSANPAISALIQKVDRVNLERMRDVKYVMTDLINRVGAIKKELEDILDDDEDMADMYLERRAALLDSAAATRAASARASDAGTPNNGSPRGVPSHFLPSFDERGPREKRVSPHDIEEAENLVESYFMQMNLLLSRLFMVKERIDDTEDLINIELDHRRNELVAFNLIVTILAASFGLVAMVGGIFGMNLHPLPIETSSAGFYSATFGGIGLALLLLFALLGYARTKGLLFIPEAKL